MVLFCHSSGNVLPKCSLCNKGNRLVLQIWRKRRTIVKLLLRWHIKSAYKRKHSNQRNIVTLHQKSKQRKFLKILINIYNYYYLPVHQPDIFYSYIFISSRARADLAINGNFHFEVICIYKMYVMDFLYLILLFQIHKQNIRYYKLLSL